MGFLTSARKEYKGDRTRAVVSHEPGVDFSKLIQSARGLDMVINYYKKGYNGYYAPVQTKVCPKPYCLLIPHYIWILQPKGKPLVTVIWLC